MTNTQDLPEFGMRYPGIRCECCNSEILLCVDPGQKATYLDDGKEEQFGRPVRGWCFEHAPFLRGRQLDLFNGARSS